MRTFARPLIRHFLALSLFSALPLACGGQLFLNADDAITDFEAIDRDGGDANGSDDDNGGDGSDGGGDFSGGDNIIGDGFGPGDDGPEPCGFGGVCPSGQECIEGGCVAICNEARCGAARLCCANEGTRTECAFDRCQEPCPNSTDIRCGTEGQLCCDVGANQVCGTSLTCVQNCTGQGPLCGNGTAGSFGSVCCNARSGGTSEDDDVCVFDKCVQRGGECESFLDCESGEYCELTLHQETGGEPDTGYCLPNEFPPDAPICQEAPTNLFVPITEWSWVGIQLVGSDLNDTNFDDNFALGQAIPKCADASSTNCYREPCTDLPSTATPAQSGNFKSQCFRSVETVPTTADVDQVTLPGGVGQRPEVVFKAYADNSFDNTNNVVTDPSNDPANTCNGNPCAPGHNGNLLVIADGRADADLPDTGTPSKQQRTKVVIYGETRGHMAIGNLDADPQLEIVAAHRNGLCAYDPYDTSGNPVANARKWCTTGGSLNTRYSGAAPSLTDFDADGIAEIVMAGTVVRYTAGGPTLLIDLLAANQGAESNTAAARCTASDQECFSVPAVADVNLDNFPELLMGATAWTIRHNPSSSLGDGTTINGADNWRADRIWVAHHDDNNTVCTTLKTQAECTAMPGCAYAAPNCTGTATGGDLVKGFPGVGDFVNNRNAPYMEGVNTPEVAIVSNGRAYILNGGTGAVLRSRVAGSSRELNFKLLNSLGGPPNIADFDGDGRPEVSFAGTGCMVVVDPDCAAVDAAGRDALVGQATSGCNVARPVCSQYLDAGSCGGNAACTWTAVFNGGGAGVCQTKARPQATCSVEVNAAITTEVGLLWMYQTQDQSSAVTGTSVFDFQGDGKAEVLYNDECFFRVFEGATSNILYERPNSHRTATEYPIVVDVDGDSNSEIVVVSTGDQSSKYSGDRDRCGGPALNTTAGQTACATGDNRTCSNRGGCGYTATSTCVTCDQFISQATCTPTKTENTTACTARGNNANACTAAGGCGLNGSNNCVACTALTTQGTCESATNANGCYWNGGSDNHCYAACDRVGDRAGDADATNVSECNATPQCVSLTSTICAQKPNGCAWVGGACVQDCNAVTDGGDTNGDFNGECNALPACHSLLGTCKPYSYRRAEWERYTPNACSCGDHTGVDDCNAARGCQWTGSCTVVSAATCAGFNARATCQQHMDDCLWDAYANACKENPRGQAYICSESTFGVTAFGDPADQWVRTLPYWHEHAFHITNEDRFGTVVPDWHVCYGGPNCVGITAEATCEATAITNGSPTKCTFGESNPDFYNNFRQNVPGFVPLNAPDLRVETAVADLRTCPPSVKIIARVVNKGRAGIKHTGVKVGFYRLASESQTYQQTVATTTPFAAPELPVDLLPGGGVDIQVTYTIPGNEAPIDLDFRVIANPDFIASPGSSTFECNATNNFKDVLNIDCTSTGG